MVAQPQVSRRCSSKEYLEREVASDIRHEYIQGKVVPMTGGTPNHNQIMLNLAGALNFVLRQQPYRVFAADQRLWIPEPDNYTYPDVMVVEGELTYKPGRKDTITNPILIMEVLSASTRTYDRGDKFVFYRTIPSFREYVLVDQYSSHVEHHVKTGPKQWMMQEYDGMEALLKFSTLNFEMSLADIYTKVNFEPSPGPDNIPEESRTYFGDGVED